MGWQALLDKIEEAAVDLARLEITTTVTTAGSDDPTMKLYTAIDQITGDVTNTFTASTFDLPYGDKLFDFHQTQRDQGTAILERNIKAIKALVEFAKEGAAGKFQPQGHQPTPPDDPTG